MSCSSTKFRDRRFHGLECRRRSGQRRKLLITTDSSAPITSLPIAARQAGDDPNGIPNPFITDSFDISSVVANGGIYQPRLRKRISGAVQSRRCRYERHREPLDAGTLHVTAGFGRNWRGGNSEAARRHSPAALISPAASASSAAFRPPWRASRIAWRAWAATASGT